MFYKDMRSEVEDLASSLCARKKRSGLSLRSVWRSRPVCSRVRMRLADSRYEMELMSMAARSTVACTHKHTHSIYTIFENECKNRRLGVVVCLR